jgi:cellulose synthase/poly-beta-1,6-N-acetylglucosamine synthase-like glycosyltransferase
MGATGIGFSFYLFSVAHNLQMWVVAIFFTILAISAAFFSAFTAYMYYKAKDCDAYVDELRSKTKPLKAFPTVAVVMPVFNEGTEIIEKNMRRLMDMEYPKDRINYYLLDDSTDTKIAATLRAFSQKNGISYIHRENRKGFKAGAFNNMLLQSKEEFLVLFDYDEYLTNTHFLTDLLPFFEDKKLCYLQTEKHFSKGNFFSDTVDLFNGFFFKFIQSARIFDNTAMFAGSCGIIRTKTIKELGGFPEYVTEDTFFSFESDMHGYKGLYIPEVYALGEPMNTFTALAKQQWRYNYGVNQFMAYYLRHNHKKKVSLKAQVEYIAHGFGLNFLSLVLILFTIASLLLVFFAFPFSSFTLSQFLGQPIGLQYLEVLGMFSFLLSLAVPIVLTKIYFKSLKKGVMLFALNFALAFIRTKAAIAAIFNRSPYPSWTKTSGENANSLYAAMAKTRVELAFSLILFVAAFVALWARNTTGGIWLCWYGAMYILATILFYKYG